MSYWKEKQNGAIVTLSTELMAKVLDDKVEMTIEDTRGRGKKGPRGSNKTHPGIH